MHRIPVWTAAVLAAGLSTAHAEDTLKHCLVHGVFKAEAEAQGEGAIHPLDPSQKLAAYANRNVFRIVSRDTGEGFEFPVLAGADTDKLADLKEFQGDEATFLAPVDLTGTGVSDLIFARKGMGCWKVLSNGTRLPKAVPAFVAGFYEKGSTSLRTETIPADTGNLDVDGNFLAAVGDFLGNGTEQLAYTRPGHNQIWVVGIGGVIALKADLTGIEAASTTDRAHWLFPYKATRKGQRTRLAYYRKGADHLLRLVPKGMEYVQEKVPLKGNWERLSQTVMDWPQPAAGQASPASAPAQAQEPATENKEKKGTGES